MTICVGGKCLTQKCPCSSCEGRIECNICEGCDKPKDTCLWDEDCSLEDALASIVKKE